MTVKSTHKNRKFSTNCLTEKSQRNFKYKMKIDITSGPQNILDAA